MLSGSGAEKKDGGAGRHRAGMEDGGVHGDAGAAVLREVAEERAVGFGRVGVEGDHAAAWNAFADVEERGVAGVSQTELLAGEGLLGEGRGIVEVEDEIVAESLRGEGVAQPLLQEAKCSAGDQAERTNVGARDGGGVFEEEGGARSGDVLLEMLEELRGGQGETLPVRSEYLR